MAVPPVSLNRPQEPSFPLSPPFSLEDKVKSVALAILTAVAVGVIVYLISSSWPVSLIVGGIIFLLLCLWIYNLNPPIETQPQLPLEEASRATTPIALIQPPSSQEVLPTHSDSTSTVSEDQPQLPLEKSSPPGVLPIHFESTSTVTSSSQISRIQEPVSQVSYQWQKEMEALMRQARPTCTQAHMEQCRKILEANREHINDPLEGRLANGTLFHMLAGKGPSQFVSIFKDFGVDFAIRDEGLFKNTALHYAIANARNATALEIIRLAPAETLDIQCTMGNTPLHLTIAKGYTNQSYDKQIIEYPNFELTKSLIARGAKIDIPNYAKPGDPFSGGNTAFHIACARRDTTTMQLLMTKNPCRTLPNNNAQTVLDLIHFSYQEACDLLRSTVSFAFLLNEIDFNANAQAAYDILHS